MKKLLIGVSTVAVLSIGGLLVSGQISEDEPKEKVAAAKIKNSQEVEKAEEKKEVVEIPTVRTSDESTPWVGDNERIEMLQNDGEVVFLFSDADEVENRVIEVAGVDENAEAFKDSPNNYTKNKMATTTAENLGLFIKEISQYVDNQAYFDKLKEVEQSMVNEQYDAVPKLIEEAKTLRESK